MQGDEFDVRMTRAVQLAYYTQARNPSDDSTLIELADELGLDTQVFAEALVSEAVQQQLLDSTCDQPLEVCLLLGFYAEYYVEQGMGRRISQEEALEVLAKAEEAGLIHQIPDSQDPGAICSCCPDCCGELRVVKMLPNPAALITCSYFCQPDPDLCNGCEICLDRCSMGAISITKDQAASINLDKCIGCGLCVNTCPEEALTLVLKPEDERREPPVTSRFMRSSQDIESGIS